MDTGPLPASPLQAELTRRRLGDLVARDQHRVWETIAESFDASRTRRWPHVERFLRALPKGAAVLDVMAGNGRHTASILEAGHGATWLDWSRPAARIVRKRYPAAQVLVGDAAALPLRSASFDAAILVAALHSLPTPEGRAACLQGVANALRPGGLVQVTVWSRDAPRFAHQGTPGQTLDVRLPWRSHGHDEERQYHLYTPQALRAGLADAGLEVVHEEDVAIVSPTPDNLVAVARRPGPGGQGKARR